MRVVNTCSVSAANDFHIVFVLFFSQISICVNLIMYLLAEYVWLRLDMLRHMCLYCVEVHLYIRCVFGRIFSVQNLFV